MDFREKIAEILENASKKELERVYWFLLGYIKTGKEDEGCERMVSAPTVKNGE